MTYIMVDIEADGPIPGDYSMISFAAIIVQPKLDTVFYGELKPISDRWLEDALKVSGFSRAGTLQFEDPKTVMQKFADWIAETPHSHHPLDDVKGNAEALLIMTEKYNLKIKLD